jgi:hypothetical protein
MRRIGSVFAVAVLVAAVSATSAVALPEIGRCVAKAGTGKYKNANCTEKAGTKPAEKQFEFLHGTPAHAIGEESTGAVEPFGETERGLRMTCTGETAVGEFKEVTGKIKEVTNLVRKFTGCLVPVSKAPCQNEAAGEVVFKPMSGKLGYISGKGTPSPVAGLELHPLIKKSLMAEFTCTGVGTFKVGEGLGKGRDCFISAIGPVNLMTAAFTVQMKGTVGIEEPTHFEGSLLNCQPEVRLGEGGWEKAAGNVTSLLTNLQELEIKA